MSITSKCIKRSTQNWSTTTIILTANTKAKKKRSSRYKRQLDAVQEELVASNKKLTVTEVQLEESKRRIVVFEEQATTLKQEKLIERAIQNAMEANKKNINCVVM